MKDINGIEIYLGDIVEINGNGRAIIINYGNELCTEDIQELDEDTSICALSENWKYKIIKSAASAESQPAIIQLKAEIRAISDIIEVSESGIVTVDFACLKRRLRELSAV